MAKIMAPIVVSGLEVVRRAIAEITIEFDKINVSEDYISGFLKCRECILHAIDELIKAEGKRLLSGRFYQVLITDADDFDLYGKLI